MDNNQSENNQGYSAWDYFCLVLVLGYFGSELWKYYKNCQKAAEDKKKKELDQYILNVENDKLEKQHLSEQSILREKQHKSISESKCESATSELEEHELEKAILEQLEIELAIHAEQRELEQALHDVEKYESEQAILSIKKSKSEEHESKQPTPDAETDSAAATSKSNSVTQFTENYILNDDSERELSGDDANFDNDFEQ